MSDDERPVIGPQGEPVIGLETRHVDARGGPPSRTKAPPKAHRPSPHPKSPLYEHRGNFVPDPLDRGAKLDAPKPVVAIENAIVFTVVARMDGGPWSHALANDGARQTYESQERAEGIAEWLRKKSVRDVTGVEYRTIPLIRGPRPLA